MQVVFCVIMFIIGAGIGSFLCCQVRRMRLRETKKNKKLGKWSVCLKCGYKLKWYENIPIVSWIGLRGKCKKCKKRIGYLEIFSEVATGIVMALIGSMIDVDKVGLLDWLAFVGLVLCTSSLIFLALYDGMYGELPVGILILAAVLAVVYAVLKVVQGELVPVEAVISAAILGGLYLVLYLISKGKWVGDGDWILAGIIGLAIGQPFFALVALFVSNFSACVIMWPYVHKSKNHKIYFGPFLVFGFILALIISNYVIINLW